MSTQTWKQRVSEYMKQHHMADVGDGILAAVSGGADSVCLLLILKALETELGIHVAAFHLNHGLRGEEADRDETYVAELCGRLNVPLKVVHEAVEEYAADRGLSVEEAGRVLRYRHLQEAAEEFCCGRIATAHHKDDDVETVLMNLFRGTGLRGLGGIHPVRDNIIRPLLCMTRQEIEAYLMEETIAWCEDSTNGELDYTRNKVRNVLLPWIRENMNDQADKHILRVASLAAQADEYFAVQAEKMLCEAGDETMTCADHVVQPGGKYSALARISIEVFDAQSDIMKTYLVRAMIARALGSSSGTAKDISARHIEAICALTGPGAGTTVDLPYGLKAARGYHDLEIRKQEPEIQNVEITVETRVFPWKKELEIPKNQYTKWFDYDKINTVLSVRARKTGDFIVINDGKTKKLNRFFIDEKIPEELRNRIPLLADGNHILWIVGYRISDYYKLSDTTRTVLEVRVDKGENHG